MAKPLVLIALLLIASLAACVAHAFVLRPTSVSVIGSAKKGQYLWKPQRAISLSPTIGATRVSLSKDDCDDRAGECQYAIVFTTDSGNTFHIDERAEVSDFCGLGGVKLADEAKKSVSLTCVTSKLVEKAPTDDKHALAYATKVFTFVEGSDKVEVTEGNAPAVFNAPTAGELAVTAEDTAFATRIYMGDTIATFDGPTSKGIIGRNAEVTLANGTAIHAFYKSADSGASHEFVSYLPFPMGVESALHVTGATKVMVIAGESGNFKQAVSVFLGSRWEKIENVTYASPLSTFSSELGTTIYGGLRGRPGLVGMAAGRKRGTEKLVDFAALHNRATSRMINGEAVDENGALVVPEGTDVHSTFFKNTPVGNFSSDFLNATEFDCSAGGSIEDVNGCATSSYTSILSFGNGSTIFAIYDKLNNGYNPSSGALGEQTLYAMKMFLNETKEMREAEEKAKEEERAEEKRKAAEEKRKQAQREAEQREREKKRKKLRADKKKKRDFRKMDKENIEREKAFLAAHAGEEDIAIIRDVQNDFIEQERDTFFDAFGPDAEAIAAAEAKEDAEAEAKLAKKSGKKVGGEASKPDEDNNAASDEGKKEDSEQQEKSV